MRAGSSTSSMRAARSSRSFRDRDTARTTPRLMSMRKKLAILVGGGPAPGINSVIGAAAIRSHLEGVEVLGIRDGFERVMQGDMGCARRLGIDDVSRIHFRGVSHIRIS